MSKEDDGINKRVDSSSVNKPQARVRLCMDTRTDFEEPSTTPKNEEERNSARETANSFFKKVHEKLYSDFSSGFVNSYDNLTPREWHLLAAYYLERVLEPEPSYVLRETLYRWTLAHHEQIFAFDKDPALSIALFGDSISETLLRDKGEQTIDDAAENWITENLWFRKKVKPTDFPQLFHETHNIEFTKFIQQGKEPLGPDRGSIT